jgi:hypothetical protein
MEVRRPGDSCLLSGVANANPSEYIVYLNSQAWVGVVTMDKRLI